MLAHLLIISLGIVGFIESTYIYRNKRKQKVLVCPLHADCETVVHSEFSRFFGIPVELLGAAYYGTVATAFAAAVLAGILPTGPAFLLTAGAFLFSVYLTFIQAFTLRQWCSWCLGSAGLSTGIFVLALWLLSWEGLLVLLSRYELLLETSQLLGLAIGLGGATVSFLLLFRFLRDLVISSFEAEVLRIISQAVWLALAVLTICGVGLYLPAAAALAASAHFLLSLFVLTGLVVSSAFLTLSVVPRLISLATRQARYPGSRNATRLRRSALALGAVSLISWYSLFFLVTLPVLPLSVPGGAAAYLAAAAAAAAFSRVAGQRTST
ncbi:MAG: hypothetical protein COT71_04550 [Candidatus Andersenbacteria bacterium CG10_big_fil_rev_8_21_14_0_10_54_11]|uniref:Vitamin K epoxide reductase domain-containing protein n=1 Tax=Candidatus Andersenbacteria bacterium CG10_big_fil_rev_8_21_14_0_10_54_11 TaxID=1974485 RepID=A0A2M6WY38_9BACT|nr:MAG: hypothetical protein COT71_04550 [Candidatus Andersenbacteria bacterium CG10_big_fil_rev_8_21_14_0_10_54_11]